MSSWLRLRTIHRFPRPIGGSAIISRSRVRPTAGGLATCSDSCASTRTLSARLRRGTQPLRGRRSVNTSPAVLSASNWDLPRCRAWAPAPPDSLSVTIGEGTRTGALRTQGEGKAHELALHREAVGQTALHRGSYPRLVGHRGDFRMSADRAGEPTPLGELFALFDKNLHDPDPVSLISIDRLARQKDAARLSVAHEARQPLRKAARAEPAMPDFRGGELRVLRSDANVAVEGDLEAASKGPAFHRRDKRLTKGAELERVVDRIAPCPGV